MFVSPNIILKTTRGEINVKNMLTNYMDSHFTNVYFNIEVIKKYENDTRYRIDDDGGIHYYGIWGVYRGIHRVGDEILCSNIGDLFGSLPYEEWNHWASFNIEPLSIEEHQELNKMQPIITLINHLLKGIDMFELSLIIYMNKLGLTFDDKIFRFSENQKNNILTELKKAFTIRTDRNEFLNRIVELSKLLIDSLNTDALRRCVDFFYPSAKFDEQGQPKGSLKLLLSLIELKSIFDICIISTLPTTDIITIVQKYYTLLQQEDLETGDDFILSQISEKIKQLRDDFAVLFTLYALRSKAGGAHLGSDLEFIQSMKLLGFPPDPSEYLNAYRTIINNLISFLTQY